MSPSRVLGIVLTCNNGLLYASMGKADMAVTSKIPRPTVRVDQQPNPELIPPSGLGFQFCQGEGDPRSRDTWTPQDKIAHYR